METLRLVTSLKAVAAASHTRRAALRGVGLGGLAAGLFGAIGAPLTRAQDWTGAGPAPTTTPAANGAASFENVPAAGAPTSFAGVTGGLPPFSMNLDASASETHPAGSIRWGTKRQLPVLQGIALSSEYIEPNGVRELHWHLNAHELNYVTAGQGRIGVFSNDGTGQSFDVQPGSISFVPNGFTHYIQNTGSDPLQLIIAFNHEQPETTDLSQALPSFPQQLLAQTFGVAANKFPFLGERGNGVIVPMAAPPKASGAATPAASSSSQYAVQADQIELKEFPGGGGTARPLSEKDIPTLKEITVYLLHMIPRSLREPHWHPQTVEFSYCLRGLGQIGLVAPDGSVQTFAVEPGTISYIPSNWVHYIASISDDPLDFLVFFAGPEAAGPHIELSETVGYFPPEVVAASFGVDPAAFATLPNRGNVFLAAPVKQD